MTKTCTGCKEDKPFSEYTKHKRGKYGLNPRCKDCTQGASKKFREENPDHKKTYVENNKERIREQERLWRINNAERYQARIQEWRDAHPDNVRAWSQNATVKRRHLIGDQKIPSNTVELLANFYGRQCLAPGCEETEDLHLDHVIPLSKGGPHTLGNLQLLCSTHNLSKGNRSSADYRDHRRGILTESVGY